MTGGTPSAQAQHVVVVGAGVAGLTTALLLARDGHRVTLVERDRLPGDDVLVGGDVEQLLRSGTPQARHSHAFLGRARHVLAAELPHVLDALHAAGATDYQVLDDLPDTIDDRTPRPGDDDLVLLACRRTTFEAVLRRAVRQTSVVDVRDGTAVDGLITAAHAPGDSDSGSDGDGDGDGPTVPTVRGLRLQGPHGEETLSADLVVLAGGPRSPVPEWLAAVGVHVAETDQDSGIVYLSRFFRSRPAASAGERQRRDRPGSADASAGTDGRQGGLGLLAADLGYLKCAVFRGDNDTFSVTFAPRSSDDALRAALRHPDGFQRACAQFGAIAPWVGPDAAEPLSDVAVMARLGNRQRQFLDDAGRPVVHGLHAVGDAHTATNPLYGRGCAMAVLHATLLAHALRHHPTDPDARARAYEAATAAEISPWYELSVAQDRFNQRLADRARRREQPSTGNGRGHSNSDSNSDGGAPDAEADDGSEMLGKVLREGLLPASRTDAVVARAFLRVVNALQTPASLLSDTDVVGRVMATMANPPEPEVMPEYRVRRVDLLEAIS